MNRHIAFAAILCCATLATHGAHAAETELSSRDVVSVLAPAAVSEAKRLLSSAIEEGNVAGGAHLVVRNGETIHFEIAGKRDIENGLSFERDSILRFYSMSKPITSVAAMTLFEKGKFKLDDPVSNFIPDFKGTSVLVKDGDATKIIPAKRQITVRDVFRHTTGYSYGEGNPNPREHYEKEGMLYWGPAGMFPPQMKIEKAASALARIPAQHHPGERFTYGFSTDLLGRLVEVWSGQSLDEYLQKEIFTPLEMVDTGFSVPRSKRNRFGSCHTLRDGKLGIIDKASSSEFNEGFEFLSGGGGLVSTIQDYANFCQMLVDDGRFKECRILKSETVRLMFTDQLNGVAGNFRFGLGFAITEVKLGSGDEERMAKQYSWGGYASTDFRIVPDEGLFQIAVRQRVPSDHSLAARLFPIIYRGLRAATKTSQHWNQFRGPGGDGIATTQNLPVEFDESNNVQWKIPIPDEGWSSPVVWENEIWLTSGSDEKKELSAICVDLQSGKVLRNIKVFDMVARKVDPAYLHDSPHLNSPATPTPVVEADRVFVSFGSQGIACLDRKSGEKLWERRDLRIYQPVRQGSSPIVDDRNLYVAFDGTDQQFFVALDKATGKTRWKADRNVQTDWNATLRARGFAPKKGGKPNDNKKSFATAALIEVNGRRQLIAPAAEATIAYDPDTGKELWRVLHPGGFNVSARPIYANGLVYIFTSGLTGYLIAIKPDGRGDVTDSHVAWTTTRSTPHIPSPVIVGDLLFMVTDKGGIARCLDATTGRELWKMRLGGNHWASPLCASGRLYFSSRQGNVAVIEATEETPEILAQNEMNGSFIASPAVAGSSLILRSTTHLYCLTKGYTRSEAEIAREMKDSPRKVATASREDIDWDAVYNKCLKSQPALRKKIESGGATKEQVIAWLKQKSGKQNGNGKTGSKSDNGGRVNFYAVVIGRLRSKDIELGEFTFEVDFVTSMYGNRWVKDKIVGRRIRVTGVSGPFIDKLLQIKRGDTLKVRSGSYIAAENTLTFGPKFHVLERTTPFKPENFGVPPKEFRGFQGELTGTIVEAAGYEVLMSVSAHEPGDENRAAKPDSILKKRVRIVGFYGQHRTLFEDLHEGDTIRVGVAHSNPTYDEFSVTDLLKKIEK